MADRRPTSSHPPFAARHRAGLLSEAVLHRLRRKAARVLRAGYQPPFAEVYVRYGTQRAILFSPAAPCAADLMRLARQARLLERFGGKRDGRAWDRLLKVPLYPYQREGVLFASQAAWDVLHMRDVMRC